MKLLKTIYGLCAATTLTLALVWTTGCATHQGRSVETSGFLGDYSQLHEGKGREALLTYTNPRANFRQYNKIMLDPIKVYPGVGDSLLGSISRDDMQKLVNYLDAAMRQNLGDKFTFVNRPGPGTMRFRIALTEAKGSKVALDLVSSVVPVGAAVSALKTVVTGSGSAVGKASAEFEAVDSLTGERLAAAVDRRIGNKYTFRFDKFSRSHAIKAAFDYWAKRMKTRLTQLQAAK